MVADGSVELRKEAGVRGREHNEAPLVAEVSGSPPEFADVVFDMFKHIDVKDSVE